MIQKTVAYTVRDDMQHTQVQYHIHYKQIILAYYGDNEPVNSTLYVLVSGSDSDYSRLPWNDHINKMSAADNHISRASWDLQGGPNSVKS